MSRRWLLSVFSVAALSIAASGWLTSQSVHAQGGGARGGPAGGPGAGPGVGQGAGQGPGQGGRGPNGPAGRGQPPRDNSSTAFGTGLISGTVVVEATGTPVRRARVTLTGAELRGGRSVMTDDAGTFSFNALPAGRFTMTASKAGYVDNAYGAKRAGRPGTPIQLAEAQKIEKAVIALPRGGVITGVVVDENGEASAGTQIRAFRYVMRTGERTLQQAGQDQTDDRGIYRIYQLQPGDYVVSAVPRNMTVADLRQTIVSEVQSLMQQIQAAGRGAGAPAAAGGSAIDLASLAARGGANQQLVDRVAQLQQQLSQSEGEQTTAYAPVYFPGTTAPSGAATVSVAAGEEKGGVDFQLQLVQTARVEGFVTSPDGQLPPGTQVALVPTDRGSVPNIPGVNANTARVAADGRFAFTNVTPGQYSVQARATIRQPLTAESVSASIQAARGQGPGRGGPIGGAITQVLWAAMDVAVAGQAVSNLSLNLAPGMTVSGRVDFQGSGQAPTDFSRVRLSLTPRGQQTFEIGTVAPAQVDANGHFTIPGVSPGRYVLTASVGPAPVNGRGAQQGAGTPAGRGAALPGQGQSGRWMIKSAVAGGRDVLDFPMDIGPGQEPSNINVTFTDKAQELSGTIQDPTGRPTADYTIVVFPADSRYWQPQARRIASARPGTDGRFSFMALPAGEYRLTAVTDVEPGEWYDPAFLAQLGQASIAISLGDGEKKTQDIKVAGN